MSKKEYYTISKNVSKILQGKNTNFLDPAMLKKVTAKLKKEAYKIYYPYQDSERALLYVEKIPKIDLVEIISDEKLEHREIMGTLYNLSIKTEMFGDIIINNGQYYIIIMDSIHDILMKEVNKIGNKKVRLINIPLENIKNFKTNYEEIKIIVPSLRIDAVVAKITKESRNSVKKKFDNNDIILNYETCNKQTHILKENDIFSIRKYGKYKFEEIMKKNKKDNYVILINKYSN